MDKSELKQILKEMNISQAELARRIEVHPQTVARWDIIPGPVKAYVLILYANHRIYQGDL